MKFLLGLIIGLLFLPAIGYLYFHFGYAPVATAEPQCHSKRCWPVWLCMLALLLKRQRVHQCSLMRTIWLLAQRSM